jgi:hypothetical protein
MSYDPAHPDAIPPTAHPKVTHYYGDIERQLFLLAAVVMLVGFFFLHEAIRLPPFLSIAAIVAVVILAGLVSPRQWWLTVANVALSFFGLVIFGFEAFATSSAAVPKALPWVNLLLSVIFLFGLYFSTKTLRWRFGKGRGRLWDKT